MHSISRMENKQSCMRKEESREAMKTEMDEGLTDEKRESAKHSANPRGRCHTQILSRVTKMKVNVGRFRG